MRLSPSQRSALIAATKQHFGADARLWLFGSRVDDRTRGGDYDLLVQSSDAHPACLIDARLAFLADLHATPDFDDEKLDVVLYAPALDATTTPIQQAALGHGIELR